jgi:hypothetical protein
LFTARSTKRRWRWPWTTAIAFSLSRDEIVPVDNEDSYLLKKIRVIAVETASGSKQMAQAVAEALQE